MKQITFIRHALLEEPYTNYDRLTFKELVALATLQIEPGIHIQSAAHIDGGLQIPLREVDLVLSSNALRSRQTAQALLTHVSPITSLRQTDLLREIYFDPTLLTTEAAFKERGMPEIREALFRGMQTGIGTDSVTDTLMRVKALEKELQENSASTTLCVTHGFFMRILELYFVKKIRDPEAMTVDVLHGATNYPNARGFSIALKSTSRP